MSKMEQFWIWVLLSLLFMEGMAIFTYRYKIKNGSDMTIDGREYRCKTMN